MDDWCDATGETAIGLCDGFLRLIFEDDIADAVGDDFKLIFVGGGLLHTAQRFFQPQKPEY